MCQQQPQQCELQQQQHSPAAGIQLVLRGVRLAAGAMQYVAWHGSGTVWSAQMLLDAGAAKGKNWLCQLWFFEPAGV
jgi:hypothetical protein